MFEADIDSWRWFGLKLFKARPFRVFVCLAHAHRRFMCGGEISEGLSLLQIGRRHLLYVGRRQASDKDVSRLKICLGFVWLIGKAP